MYYVKIENTEGKGFYIEEIHGRDVCIFIYNAGGLKIDDELHDYLLTLNTFKFIGVKEDREYTINDKELFKAITTTVEDSHDLTMEERMAALEQLIMGVL